MSSNRKYPAQAYLVSVVKLPTFPQVATAAELLQYPKLNLNYTDPIQKIFVAAASEFTNKIEESSCNISEGWYDICSEWCKENGIALPPRSQIFEAIRSLGPMDLNLVKVDASKYEAVSRNTNVTFPKWLTNQADRKEIFRLLYPQQPQTPGSIIFNGCNFGDNTGEISYEHEEVINMQLELSDLSRQALDTTRSIMLDLSDEEGLKLKKNTDTAIEAAHDKNPGKLEGIKNTISTYGPLLAKMLLVPIFEAMIRILLKQN